MIPHHVLDPKIIAQNHATVLSWSDIKADVPTGLTW